MESEKCVLCQFCVEVSAKLDSFDPKIRKIGISDRDVIAWETITRRHFGVFRVPFFPTRSHRVRVPRLILWSGVAARTRRLGKIHKDTPVFPIWAQEYPVGTRQRRPAPWLSREAKLPCHIQATSDYDRPRPHTVGCLPATYLRTVGVLRRLPLPLPLQSRSPHHQSQTGRVSEPSWKVRFLD